MTARAEDRPGQTRDVFSDARPCVRSGPYVELAQCVRNLGQPDALQVLRPRPVAAP